MLGKAFCSNNKFYYYDTNSNKCFEISKDIFESIPNDGNSEKIKESDFLKKFSDKRIKNIANPITNYTDSLLQNNVSILLLQVTQGCNLRCEYCIYSGKYRETRVHNNRNMDESTAFKAIDFLLKNSSRTPILKIGYFGGEPLLNFDLIKSTVNYINKNAKYRNVQFSLTTNATLINTEIADFFANYKFYVNVSIDGEKSIHDYNRRTFDKNGSYDKIINNLSYIKQKYPEYYNNYFSINAVLDTKITNFQIAVNFFSKNEILKGLRLKISSINNVYKNEIERNDRKNKLYEKKMELLYVYKEIMGNNKYEQYSTLNELFGFVKYSPLMNYTTMELPNDYTHAGLCCPGISRVFINTDGNFFPCEKVNEFVDEYNIGNVNDGFDREKINALLNHGVKEKTQCKDCWAVRLCTFCVAKINLGSYSKEDIKNICNRQRIAAEKSLKKYVVLDEIGLILKDG